MGDCADENMAGCFAVENSPLIHWFERRPLHYGRGCSENHSATLLEIRPLAHAQGSADGATAAPGICAASRVRAAIDYVVREQVDP